MTTTIKWNHIIVCKIFFWYLLSTQITIYNFLCIRMNNPFWIFTLHMFICPLLCRFFNIKKSITLMNVFLSIYWNIFIWIKVLWILFIWFFFNNFFHNKSMCRYWKNKKKFTYLRSWIQLWKLSYKNGKRLYLCRENTWIYFYFQQF